MRVSRAVIMFWTLIIKVEAIWLDIKLCDAAYLGAVELLFSIQQAYICEERDLFLVWL